MGKSIRSKIKKKFRTIKRDNLADQEAARLDQIINKTPKPQKGPVEFSFLNQDLLDELGHKRVMRKKEVITIETDAPMDEGRGATPLVPR